jgi:hypothetical protein
MVGDFNVSGFDWKRGLSLPNFHDYSKLNEDTICTSTCRFNLSQCIHTATSTILLDIFFSYLSDLCVTPVDLWLATPDNNHHLLIISMYLPFSISIQNYVYWYRKFSSGDYALFQNILSTYDWSCVHGTTSVDLVIASLSAAVQNAMEQTIPRPS